MQDLNTHKHAETAEEFIDYLRPSAPHWIGEELDRLDYVEGNGWIFRGQSNQLTEAEEFEEWNLVPKSLRPDAFENFLPFHKDLKHNEIDASERTMINNFLKLADREGLPIPVREISREWYTPIFRDMKDEYLEAVALAQHHGIPTRFLDWTDSPYKAAFFAGLGIADSSDKAYITVWAFRASLFEYLNQPRVAFGAEEPIIQGVKIIREKRFFNGFLNAQDGCFTLDTTPTHEMKYLANYHLPKSMPYIGDFKRGSSSGYVDEFQERLTNKFAADSSFIWFHKVTLPWSEVPKLRKLLWYEGINPASLMPTYDNVAATLRYRLGLFRNDFRD